MNAYLSNTSFTIYRKKVVATIRSIMLKSTIRLVDFLTRLLITQKLAPIKILIIKQRMICVFMKIVSFYN